jgi:hypothetical protein
MTHIIVSGNFNQLIVQVNKLKNQARSDIRKSLLESANLIKKDLKTIMREPKEGVLKPPSLRNRLSPIRRSAIGEGLARDTGNAEKLIANMHIKNNSIDVGFKAPYLFNYIKYWEEHGRPTLGIAAQRNVENIRDIFQRNLKMDK